MRRAVALGAAAAMLGGGVTLGTAWASSGSGADAPAGTTAVVSDKARAAEIAASLADPAVRASYDLPDGRAVTATVCVRKSCVTETFGTAPTCEAGATCIGTALVTREIGHATTITVELV